MTRTRPLVRKRWVILLVVILLLALLNPAFRLSLFANIIPLRRVVAWVEIAQMHAWMAALFYVFFAVAIMIVPITIFPIVGGVLLPFGFALPMNIVAATIGAWLSFRVARAFGRASIEPFMKRNLRALDRLAASQGIRTVFLVRLIGVPPFIVTNYGLGLSGVRDRDYVLGTAAGIVPWMTMVTYMSTSLWEAVKVGGEKGMMSALMRTMAPLTAVSLLITVGVVVSWLLRRRRHRTTTQTYNQSPQS